MSDDPPSSDSSHESSRSDVELYRIVNRAVEDALWNVLGMLLLTGLAVFAFLVGIQFTIAAFGDGGIAAGALALVLITAAVYGFCSLWNIGPFGDEDRRRSTSD